MLGSDVCAHIQHMETGVCGSHVCGSCQFVFLFLFQLGEQRAQIQVHPCVSRFPCHTPPKAEGSVQVLSVSPSGSQVHFLHDFCTKCPYLSPHGLWGTQVLQSLTPVMCSCLGDYRTGPGPTPASSGVKTLTPKLAGPGLVL